MFSKPKRGDIVIIRYKDKTYFLKRVIGLPGDTVEFRNGDLYLNGRKQNEAYVRYASDWNLSPRKVEPGHYYVVGDKRARGPHRRFPHLVTRIPAFREYRCVRAGS